MRLAGCKEMDTFSNGAPNTALGLSLNFPAVAPPSKESPLPRMNARSMLNHPAVPLLDFLSPSLPSTLYNNKLLDHDNTASASASPSPPLQLQLLPLKPSPQKLSLSSPPPLLHWQPPGFNSPPVVNSLSSGCARGIDMNQVPVCTDREEISESSILVKRDRERSSDAEQDRTCEVSSRGSDEDGEGGSARKKLRLSKEQSTLLEESFKEHSTLNPKQKAELARQLNLRPRQVEVWFQNRRARTKLKQTEVDCELLKRCCESLTEENRRLQKEVQELRAIKVAPPCIISHDRFMPLPAATLSICPSCERVASHVVPPLPSGTQAVSNGIVQPISSSVAAAPGLSFSMTPMPSQSPHHLPLSFPSPPPHPQQALPSAAC